MCKCVNLNMLSQFLYKVAVICITIIGCFGLLGNFMKLDMQRPNDQNDGVKLYDHEHHANLNVLSNDSMSSDDLKTNSSYLYTVLVSPEYEMDEYDYEIRPEDQYEISRLNNDYFYDDYFFVFCISFLFVPRL